MVSYIKGLLDALSGFRLIFLSGVKRYLVIPLVINIALFAGAVTLLSQQMDVWMQKLLPDWLGFLEWIIWPLFAITIALVIFYSFTIVANIIAAPFNSLLSASIEARLTGQKPQDMTQARFWKMVARTVSSEVRKLLYFIKWLIPLAIVTVIPVVNVVAPFLWFVYAAWSFSLEYTDYPLGNRGKLFDDIREYNRNHRMRSLGLGTVVFVMTSIPFLNFFAMPVAVAGATRLVVKAGKPS